MVHGPSGYGEPSPALPPRISPTSKPFRLNWNRILRYSSNYLSCPGHSEQQQKLTTTRSGRTFQRS
jgi:hypothetical protein